MKRFNCASTAVKCGSDTTVSVLCVTLAALMLATTSVAQDQSSIKLTGQQVNVLVSQEATQNVVTYLTTQSGGNSLTGTWSGSVTDQGWNLSFSGSINSQAASLAESGALKGKVASWTDSGTVGSNNVSGSGTATLTSGDKLKWAQTIGEGAMPEDIIDDIQAIFCLVYPCDLVQMWSELIREGGRSVVTEFDVKTGDFFASSVPVMKTQGITTVQQGALARKTGAIAYDSDTFTPQGAGAQR